MLVGEQEVHDAADESNRDEQKVDSSHEVDAGRHRDGADRCVYCVGFDVALMPMPKPLPTRMAMG